jgi:hypothetical protein
MNVINYSKYKNSKSESFAMYFFWMDSEIRLKKNLINI